MMWWTSSTRESLSIVQRYILLSPCRPLWPKTGARISRLTIVTSVQHLNVSRARLSRQPDWQCRPWRGRRRLTIFVVKPKSGPPPESYAEAQVAHLASSEGPKRQRKHWSLFTCEPYASQLQANVSQSEDIVTGEVMKLSQDEISPGPPHLSNQDQLVDSSQTLFRRKVKTGTTDSAPGVK